ncbi:hypothetical protein [Streptomyces sp. HNM1019]|uniref:hypothetical protein n=1 Tax=Streptomyces sp. HNM1019 TaxID=3424717 RepID=UPI003D76E6C7
MGRLAVQRKDVTAHLVAMDTFAVATHRWMQEPSVSLHDQLDQAFRELRLAAAALK